MAAKEVETYHMLMSNILEPDQALHFLDLIQFQTV